MGARRTGGVRRKRTLSHAALAGRFAGAAILLGAGSLAGQTRECSGGMPSFGSLGIGEFHCVGGACAVNMRNGSPYAHSFSSEPRLMDIDRDGPGADVLRAGDVLVAIDGTLITTAEGGRKLGSVRPGQDVELTLRRNGRDITAWLTAESSCDLPRLTVTRGSALEYAQTFPLLSTDSTLSSSWVVPDSAYSTMWVYPDSLLTSGATFATPSSGFTLMSDSMWARPLYTLADSAGLTYGIATSPLPTFEGDALVTSGFTYGAALGGRRPTVEFGVELSCGDCGWRSSGPLAMFSTSVFPTIESVEKDGPADRAGLLPGDVMLAVEGSPITSREAGRRLGGLKPGGSVSIEVRRGDRIVAVEVTPREASGRRQRM